MSTANPNPEGATGSPTAADFAAARWRKSSRSSTGQCVEVAVLDHHGRTYIGVGDTKAHEPDHTPAEVLAFPRAQWARFIASQQER
ncbi:DUF397 domain-containing protein [Saccharothrix obliqua]|uniref:DUF397 domain-containing protein n=1 Tax=Saccharothrix obliqua TaxID=2861747 RepID=UPI001C5D5D82|nr:DUF397 domain-containing protein [Saccharothrix obliqua]MBW4722388.1 DUF397 domain-containing protein [Saccharothrix obliqua]